MPLLDQNDDGHPSPVTDPAIIEDINAAFALAVYEASRLREAQLAGAVLPPPARLRSRVLLRRLQVRPRPSAGRSGIEPAGRAAARGA